MTGGRGLPERIEAVIRRVLEASGLAGREREEVECDLREHFEEGLEAGRTEQHLLDRFGDPEAAGRRVGVIRTRSARDGRGGAVRWRAHLEAWWQELRRAARPLARAPGHSFIVVATLALGVGANTAVFSVVDAVLLEDLPYPEPERLVRVYERRAAEPGEPVFLRAPSSLAFHRATDVVDGFATLYTYRETGADLTDGDRPERVVTSRVSAGYFETLGIRPVLGRTFREDESAGPGEASDEDRPRVVILSHGLWQRRFGSDRAAVGRTIELDGVAHTIVGVMPRGTANPFGPRADVWVPQDLRPGGRNDWSNHFLSGVARLKPGQTLASTEARLRALIERVAETEPEAARHVPVLVPLHDDVVGPTRRPMLWLLVAAAALVLMSACVNVANLVLARGLRREREVALRGALGSGRGRIVVHLLSESVLLAFLGGAAGVALGWLGMKAILAVAPATLPVVARPRLGLDTFAFAFAATTLALAIFAAVPALRLASVQPADVLRSGERGSTHGRATRRLRDALVVVQVAVALVLLSSAGVLVRSLARLHDVPLGFEPEGVLAFEVHLPTARYAEPDARVRFRARLNERMAALPGVERAGAVSWLPVDGRYHEWGLSWDPANPGRWNRDAWQSADVRVFDGDYFGAAGIPVVRGSGMEAVRPGGEPQLWLSRIAAERVFGDAEPVGQLLSINAGRAWRVAGIVGDVAFDPRGAVAPTAYLPHVYFADDRNWSLLHVVRAAGPAAALQARMRAVLAELDPTLVLHRPRTLQEHLASARSRDRFAASLMAAFAALAFVLTVVGTYGVLAGTVAARRREIGIRMALGAGRDTVRALILRHALAMALPGLAIGLAGSLAAGRWTGALLFEVAPADPVVLCGALALLLAVSLLAGWLPARAAARVDPARTLAD